MRHQLKQQLSWYENEGPFIYVFIILHTLMHSSAKPLSPPFQYFSCIHVIMFITNMNHAFCTSLFTRSD